MDYQLSCCNMKLNMWYGVKVVACFSSAIIGNVDCDLDGCNEHVLNVRIEDVIRHPEYIGKPIAINDAALIRLKEPVDFERGEYRKYCTTHVFSII